MNVKFFGHSGVGKSTVIESLRAGYFSNFFRKSKPPPAGSNTVTSMLYGAINLNRCKADTFLHLFEL
jgi:putative ribosome biogenesis GTPase RsgA